MQKYRQLTHPVVDSIDSTLLYHLFLIVVLSITVLPVVTAIIMSTQTRAEIIEITNLMPGGAGLTNYGKVLFEFGLMRKLINSFIYSVTTVTLEVSIALLGALVLVYFDIPYKKIVFYMVLLTLLFPLPVRIVALFDFMVALGWTNSYLGLIIPKAASATSLFLFRQRFKSLPDSLVETARIDGTGPLKFLWKVLIPRSSGIIAGVAAIQFIGAWNSFLWPAIIINSDELQVASVGLRGLLSETQGGMTPWGVVMAGSILTLLPALVVLFVLRDHLLETIYMGRN